MNTKTASDEPTPERLVEKLYPIMGGHIYFQTLSAAVRFDLFGLLKERGPLTHDQIAEYLGLETKPTRILLLGCSALELLAKCGEHYTNSELADRLLVRDAPGSAVPVIEWQHFINYRAMYHFYDALKANRNIGLEEFDGDEPTLYQRLVHQPDLEKVFQDAMQTISVQANAMLAEHVDFSEVKHLVDVGGGNGTNVINLATKYPNLRATIFDSPSVCEVARNNIKAAGLENRVDTAAGNCFTDEFPEGADCLLFAHFFTIWSEDKNRLLLRKCYGALPPDGKVILFNMMQHDDQTGPLSAALGSPYFLTLATGEGMLYSASEYRAWMAESGFSQIRTERLPRDHAAIEGVKT